MYRQSSTARTEPGNLLPVRIDDLATVPGGQGAEHLVAKAVGEEMRGAIQKEEIGPAWMKTPEV